MKSFFDRHSERIGILMGAITLVGMGFLGQRLLQVDRPCLSFNGVIEMRFDGVIEPLRSCQSESRFTNPKVSDEHRKILDVVNQMKSLESMIPGRLRGVFVTVTSNDPFFYIQSERSLVIGAELANQPEFLQRAILNALTAQALSGQGTKKKELASDLLWAFFKGDDFTKDPSTFEDVHTAEWVQWAQTPRTVAEYCAHPLRRIEDLSFCRFELNKDQEVSNWVRYRPLISWSILQVLREKGMWSISTAIRELFAPSPESAIAEQVQDESDMDWVKLNTVEWLLSMKVDAGIKDISSVWSNYKIDTEGDFHFVVTVDSQQLADQVVSSLITWQQESILGKTSRILVITPTEQMELPLVRQTFYELDKVKSETYLVMGCELPAMRDVANLNATNFLALKVCNSQELPQWVEILKEGKLNKTALMEFHLHLPSMHRWAKNNPKIYASNDRLDTVFCNEKTFSGYPFQAFGCGQKTGLSSKSLRKTMN